MLGLAAAESRELENKGIGVLELAAVLAPVSDGSRLQGLLESSRSFPLLDPCSILFCRSTLMRCFFSRGHAISMAHDVSVVVMGGFF